MDKYITDRMFFYDIPGLCVSIRKGNDVCRKAYGDVNIESIFHCASISKIVTAKTAEAFNIDVRVKELLPYADIDDRVTLEMLLNHTSGIGDISDYGWEKADASDDALERYIRGKRIPVWAEPGNRFIYSNDGYDIAGACIAKLSGMSYEDAVEEKVFRPAGMETSSMNTAKREDKEYLASPHVKDTGGNVVLSEIYPYTREHAPSSCLTAPIGDLEKLASFLMENMTEIEKTPVMKVTDSEEYVSLGWFIKDVNGKRMYGHEGRDLGFSSSFWICPEEDAHLILLADISTPYLKSISKYLNSDIFIG